MTVTSVAQTPADGGRRGLAAAEAATSNRFYSIEDLRSRSLESGFSPFTAEGFRPPLSPLPADRRPPARPPSAPSTAGRAMRH